MIYFLIITAFTVSIDSFICGFSLSLNKLKKTPIILGITLTVLFMCTVTNYGATFLSEILTQKTASLGGIILVAIGLYNLLKKEKPQSEINSSSWRIALITGFAVGLDGSLANLSLSLMGMNGFYVPLTIALFHGILISLGTVLAGFKHAKKVDRLSKFAPLVLIGLGIYKIIDAFL